jgi:filamentous hemagglutinin family protein
MKRTRIGAGIAISLACVVFSGCHMGSQKAEANKVPLWNGKDFTGWKRVLADPAVNVDDVWKVRDGVLYCAGKPNGYMRTETKYSNYHLHVEWRWPDKPANSGVFVHLSEPDRVWPSCIECQLQAEHAGDLILMNGTGLTVNGTARQNASRQFVSVVKKGASSEKPAGEWNSYDIYCEGSSLRSVVNGVVQNEGANAIPSIGYIALQSEGGPVEFRNVYIVLLGSSSVPPSVAKN